MQPEVYPEVRRFTIAPIHCLIRLLDPILLILLNPSIMRHLSHRKLGNHLELSILTYRRPFEQEQVLYVLDMLNEVMQYGGANLMRSLSSIPVQHAVIQQFAGIQFKEFPPQMDYLSLAVLSVLQYVSGMLGLFVTLHI